MASAGGVLYVMLCFLFSQKMSKSIQEVFHTKDACVRCSFNLVMENISNLTLMESG